MLAGRCQPRVACRREIAHVRCRDRSPLSLTDLTWAISEMGEERAPEWVATRVQLLLAYGLVERDETGFRVALGGPGTLARTWVASR